MTFASALRDEQAALALERLGRGLNLSAGALMVIELCSFLLRWGAYTQPALSVAAWIVLAATAGFTMIGRFERQRTSGWGTIGIAIACLVVVVLDVAATWDGSSDGSYPAAATAVSGVVVSCANSQRLRYVLGAAAVLCLALMGFFLTSISGELVLLGPRVIVVLLAGLPPLIAVSVVRSFRSLVQVESDRAQVQATTSSPGIAVGMLASKELARLDLEAERLLTAVATGTAALPLDTKTAAAAADLATELRLRLIAGRDKTWLYHAVAESAVLGPVVSITDPQGLAALMPTTQRDALLSAIWLFAGDRSRLSRSLHIDVSNAHGDATEAYERIRIELEATGVPRKQVDPAVWQAIRKVGSFAESSRGMTLSVSVDCHLDGQAIR